MAYLGLGKTLFSSSACLVQVTPTGPDIELVLTERISRKKASGAWPEQAILRLKPGIAIAELNEPHGALRIAENRDVRSPSEFENDLNDRIPFFPYLESHGLTRYSRHFNSELKYVTHHLSHASAATLMSPFERSVILVLDGAGSRRRHLEPSDADHLADGPGSEDLEECSIFLQEGRKLRAVRRFWQRFTRSQAWPEHHFSPGTGTLYEKSAEMIFNSGRSAGKVMGLAPFGEARSIDSDTERFLENLPWQLAFKGRSKLEWDTSPERDLYVSLAATVQRSFEERLHSLVQMIRADYPSFENLILAGGCALNCTNNMKLVNGGWFKEIYVPPFPGDEGIGLGAAAHLWLTNESDEWKPLAHGNQHGYFGPKSSVPDEAAIQEAFGGDPGFRIERPGSIADHSAGLLAAGKIIGWFQGRSECGPRALGNRSILARPDRPGVKDELNQRIKFREDFRPYGSSVTFEKAHEYFEIPPGFQNPYMSFATRTRPDYRQRLNEVTHVDGSSRMQTVMASQNPRFHDLLTRFGERTGLFCLLNTSLNVMGQPIVETLADARDFLRSTPVHALAAGDFVISKP